MPSKRAKYNTKRATCKKKDNKEKRAVVRNRPNMKKMKAKMVTTKMRQARTHRASKF